MKFNVEKNSLLLGLSSLSKNQKAAAVEIVEIKAAKEMIVLRTNNGFQQAVTKVSAEVVEGGTAVLSLKVLSDIVSLMTPIQSEEVHEGLSFVLDDKGENLGINTSSQKCNLGVLDTGIADFRKVEDGHLFKLLPEHCLTLERLKFAVSKDETKQVLTGLNLVFSEGKAELWGTDGHRLIHSSWLTEGDKGKGGNVIIPLALLNFILQVREKDNPVIINFDESTIEAQTGDFMFVTRALDGIYPKCGHLVPKDSPLATITASISELITALNLAIKCSDDKSAWASDFDIEDCCLNVSAKSRDGQSSMNHTMRVELNGPPVEFTINARYLIEGLKALNSEDVVMKFWNPKSPLIFEGKIQTAKDNEEDFAPNEFVLLMPIERV